MSIERIIFVFSGFMVLFSLGLTYFFSPHCVWLTVFVGANLFQYGFTQFCPITILLKKLGFKAEAQL